MIKILEKGTKKYFQCEECALYYETQELALECEKWCREYKSCNFEITRHSLPLEENKDTSEDSKEKE